MSGDSFKADPPRTESDAADDLPARCEWTMPADSKNAAGERCVMAADHMEHDADHVIAVSNGAGTRHVAVWFYEVNVTDRTMKATAHADFRGPADVDDEERWGLWWLLTERAARHA